jgi:hypothetical protein
VQTVPRRQPTLLEHCTVQIAIQLLPDDGDANGRRVVVGVRSHLDAPLLRFIRLNELGPLPPSVNALVDQLKAEFPAREQAALAALAKKKEEEVKRRADLEARRVNATPRDKKRAKANARSTAPTSTIAVIAVDDRPRPQVTVPTNTQQQLGLF